MSKIVDCRPVTLGEKGTALQIFFWNFRILEHPFLSEHFQKSIGRLYLWICILRELHNISFSGYLPIFFGPAVSKHLH